jgi:2-keto-3-deoxy-L-fuconate dehydrogenase
VSGEEASRLDGKVAAITGAGSDIGQAIALTFAGQGAAVRVLDVNEAAAAATCAQILDARGENPHFRQNRPEVRHPSAHRCDVTSQEQVQATSSELFRRERVHILINNAGISHIGTVESTSEEDFDRIIRVNVKGFHNCMHAVVGHMKDHGGGVIVNLASIAGSAGLADRFAYSMSKGAVIAMTYSVARDYLPYHIRCNCISPARCTRPLWMII